MLVCLSGTKCDLEIGMCDWTNTQNPELDQLDWELTSAEAETHYPIPSHDHTLGTERGDTLTHLNAFTVSYGLD